MNSKEICQEVQSILHLSQYSLEKTYRQLQENIKERFEALALQHQLNRIENNQRSISQKDQNLQHLKQTHQQMQNFYSQRLLDHQVSIQEQQQMRAIIKNYEQRIYELRSSLVNKQAEITYEVYEKKRHSLLKKQNITCLNNHLKVQQQIKKALEQLKRIKVQIQAIEHAIQFYQSQQPTKQSSQATSLSVQKCTLNIIDAHLSKEKVDLLQKDKNLSKIMTLLNQQITRNGALKQQQKILRKEYQTITNTHKQSISKYQKQILQNAIKPSQRILDLIDKSFTIQEESTQQSKETICVQSNTKECLFSQRDFNKTQQKNKVETKFRRVTLKQKRSKLFKEN